MPDVNPLIHTRSSLTTNTAESKSPLMPFINASNASELGKRSGEARRNKPVSFALSVPRSHLVVEPDLARTIHELLKVLSEQISRTRSLLNDERYRYCEHCERGGVEPNHRAQLLKALDGLIERKTALLGIPGPGQLKPSVPRTRVIEAQPSTPHIDTVDVPPDIPT